MVAQKIVMITNDEERKKKKKNKIKSTILSRRQLNADRPAEIQSNTMDIQMMHEKCKPKEIIFK